MKHYMLVLLLLFSGTLSCDKLSPSDPSATHGFITGEINGVPFQSANVGETGVITKNDLCDKPLAAMLLPKKNGDTEYQVILLNFFHAEPGNYVLTDRNVKHKANAKCLLDSIYAELYFQPYFREDWTTDNYRIVEGPWNYLEVLSYDAKKREIQAQFGAKFVRINPQQKAKEAVDTITYTKCRFILSNMQFNDPYAEPR